MISQAYDIVIVDRPMLPIVLEVATTMTTANVTYVKSYGGMGAGPARLSDLSIE